MAPISMPAGFNFKMYCKSSSRGTGTVVNIFTRRDSYQRGIYILLSLLVNVLCYRKIDAEQSETNNCDNDTKNRSKAVLNQFVDETCVHKKILICVT